MVFKFGYLWWLNRKQPELLMQAHQQRVIDEKDQLAERLGKLLAFFQGPVFPTLPVDEQTRLSCQVLFMDGYLKVLEQRIMVFSPVAIERIPGGDSTGLPD